MTVGILGGTFDPFHHGHLRVAVECREKLRLDSLRLVPLNTPPHRKAPIATAHQRLDMLKLAVGEHGFMQIDDTELKRGGVSYTIDTVKHIQGGISSEPLCLIMGSDAFNALNSWQDWHELIKYTHIVVAGRPGNTLSSNNTELSDFISQHLTDQLEILHSQPSGKLYELDIPLLDISATRIRKIIHNGKDPSGLLPDKVINYIYAHSLYQQEY